MIKTLLFVAALGAGVSQAGIIAQLDQTSLTGSPGDTLMFNVTLTNPSTTDQIWLNGIGSTASSMYLTIDTSPFNTNAPFYLDPLASSGPFELFDVTIAPGTPAGGYIGNFVTIQGGADGGAGTAFDDLADIGFDVQVQGSASTTPEPGTLGMLCAAGLLVGGRRWYRRRTAYHRDWTKSTI